MDIKRISFSSVNCYLLKNGTGFYMVDCGFSRNRTAIDNVLIKSGCRSGDLKLVLLTHGDTDHTGNAAFFQDNYGAKLCLHREEARAAASGNMLHNRKPWHPVARILAPVLMPLFGGGRKARFTPDIWLEDSDDLNKFGLDARVLHLPGHTRGSVSILTAEGDLFCGDLLVSRKRVPGKNHLIDDEAVMDASIDTLRKLGIRTVYPGHGRPFSWSEFRQTYLAEYQNVSLATDIYEDKGYSRGITGIIVDIFRREGMPNRYLVDFSSPQQQLDFLEVTADDIELAPKTEYNKD